MILIPAAYGSEGSVWKSIRANHGNSGWTDRLGPSTPIRKMGPSPREGGLGRRRGSFQILDTLLVPRDARGIVLACGFVAVAALGISALTFGDPLGYGYLAAAAMGYFFLQTRLVPTALWLLVSFGGAAGAMAGNPSGWIVCGLGLLLAVVSLLPVPAAFRGEPVKAEVRPSLSSASGASENAASVESSRKLEVSPIRTSRSPEVGAVEAGGRAPIEGIKPGDPVDLAGSDLADLTLPTADPKSLAARVAIKTIGRLRLEINGRDLTQRLNEQPRLEFLFSYLLARATRAADAAIDRPALADEVAPGIPAGNQRDRLRKQLHALQSTLGSEAKTLLRINNTHVTLDLTGVDIDTVALEQMSRLVGRRKTLIGGDLADQIRALLEETAGGEFIAGFSELEHQVTAGNGTASQTVDEARALIAGWRADLVQALADYNGAAGYPQRSIAYLKSALTQCPQRQDLARLLVAAYLETGQTARAAEARLEYDLTQEK